MRTDRAARVLVVALAALLGGTSASEPNAIDVGPRIRVFGADAEHVRLVRWAVGRFEAAGLEEPRAEIRFVGGPAACGGAFGHALGGRVEVCGTVLVHVMTRRVVLHEMSHIWLYQNLTPTIQERFLEMRGLRSWNSYADPWRLRGSEQGAEILSWELGERILSAQIPQNDPASLDAAYRLLTGAVPPAGVASTPTTGSG